MPSLTDQVAEAARNNNIRALSQQLSNQEKDDFAFRLALANAGNTIKIPTIRTSSGNIFLPPPLQQLQGQFRQTPVGAIGGLTRDFLSGFLTTQTFGFYDPEKGKRFTLGGKIARFAGDIAGLSAITAEIPVLISGIGVVFPAIKALNLPISILSATLKKEASYTIAENIAALGGAGLKIAAQTAAMDRVGSPDDSVIAKDFFRDLGWFAAIDLIGFPLVKVGFKSIFKRGGKAVAKAAEEGTLKALPAFREPIVTPPPGTSSSLSDIYKATIDNISRLNVEDKGLIRMLDNMFSAGSNEATDVIASTALNPQVLTEGAFLDRIKATRLLSPRLYVSQDMFDKFISEKALTIIPNKGTNVFSLSPFGVDVFGEQVQNTVNKISGFLERDKQLRNVLEIQKATQEELKKTFSKIGKRQISEIDSAIDSLKNVGKDPTDIGLILEQIRIGKAKTGVVNTVNLRKITDTLEKVKSGDELYLTGIAGNDVQSMLKVVDVEYLGKDRLLTVIDELGNAIKITQDMLAKELNNTFRIGDFTNKKVIAIRNSSIFDMNLNIPKVVEDAHNTQDRIIDYHFTISKNKFAIKNPITGRIKAVKVEKFDVQDLVDVVEKSKKSGLSIGDFTGGLFFGD